jgi:RNA polymerase sigma factor (sigma-70 family)
MIRQTEETASLNDHQLLSAYVQGDEEAFETLVEKYFRMVHTVAARQTRDVHLAEEIAQSVFLILSRKARGFSSRSSVPGWLLRTTRFVCLDAIKMRRRRELNEQRLAEELEHRPDKQPDPGAMELLLEEALQSLRPDEQAGIVARFFEGRDFPEIAQMFAITEDAARKRSARCLAKLQAFMARRRADVPLPALSALLLAPSPFQSSTQALQSAIQATHALLKGNVAAGNATALAQHALRLLRRRFLAALGLKLALPLLLVFVGVGSVHEWNQRVPKRIEKLGKAWGALDQRIAQHRQYIRQTPPNAPNYQARVQDDLAFFTSESTRVMDQLKPLLASPDERARLAMFLTADLDEALKLEPSKKDMVFLYVQRRLAQGATLNDGMKVLGQTTQAEAAEIKAMLSPSQQQLFDKVYGADGVILFSYPQIVALGQLGR